MVSLDLTAGRNSNGGFGTMRRYSMASSLGLKPGGNALQQDHRLLGMLGHEAH